MIPELVKESLDRYAKDKIPTGDFLRACLANDLMEAVGRADIINMRHLQDIASYIYNEIPSSCHGSYDIVREWLKRKPKGGV